MILHLKNKDKVLFFLIYVRVEEELLLRRSLGDLEGDARRATRRSFFRRKKHQRSDSKELASFSNINLGWYSDSGTLNEETALCSYQRVTRLNCKCICVYLVYFINWVEFQLLLI